MKWIVFDIETDGLLEDATQVYCLCWKDQDGKTGTLTDPQEIGIFMSSIASASESLLCGHNIIRYDIPVLQKLIGGFIKPDLLADTLALSWYLYPARDKHGLESWGETFGVPKPKIEDWKNRPLEDYIHRCQQDVEINWKLFKLQLEYLAEIYDGNRFWRLVSYLTFKMDCAREQEEVKWKLDKELCESSLQKLLEEKNERVAILGEAMPPEETWEERTFPAKPYKKDGTLSAAGEKWKALTEEMELPFDTPVVRILTQVKPGNPNSYEQVKDWLYSLGWVPDVYKLVKNKKTHAVKKIPQISDGEDVSPSVKLLAEKHPAIDQLSGLFLLNHRIGILKGFLANADEHGFLKAEVKGFTNTLRFQHTTIVNLPKVDRPYGKIVRGCLIAPSEDHILCGSDMSSLEDSTKQHYMYRYDPEYVTEMRKPGFDPHLDIAVLAGMLTPEQAENHKQGKENHKPVRNDAKQVNFSAVYGVGPPKLAATTGWPVSKAKKLLEIYWQRNWSVKKVSKHTVYKTVREQMWLYNPVSRFWYSLRFEKDKFSTLNQGTGVYCFDTWIRQVQGKGYKLCGQFHDELIIPVLKTDQQKLSEDLDTAIQEANAILKLNVTLGISKDFGNSYADIH